METSANLSATTKSRNKHLIIVYEILYTQVPLAHMFKMSPAHLAQIKGLLSDQANEVIHLNQVCWHRETPTTSRIVVLKDQN